MSLMNHFPFFYNSIRCRLTQWLVNIKNVYRNSYFLYNKNVKNNLKNSEITQTPANGLFTMLKNEKKTVAGAFVFFYNFL